MTRRRRLWRRWTNPAALLGAAVFALAACWILAPLARLAAADDARRFVQLSPEEAVQYRAMLVLAGAWFFYLGAAVGSFLNVVVWRLPRGESIVWRSSHCPRCGARIRPSDNVPVFGWLKLRGRCRACRMPISARYPLVEALTGGVFLALAVVEIFLQGANLPSPGAASYARTIWRAFELRADLAALYVYHGFFLSVLLSWALIERDRQRIPTGYVALGLLVGVMAPLAAAVAARVFGTDPAGSAPLRPLHPLPLMRAPAEWLSAIGWLSVLAEPAAGGLVGAACGVLLRPAAAGASRPPRLAAAMALVGAFLGWQAAVSAALLVALLSLFAALAFPRLAPRRVLSAAFIAALAQVFAWRFGDAAPWWPGTRSSPAAMLGYVLLTAFLALAAGRIAAARVPYAKA